ncbi:hypothetical protein BDM02DRAFT_455497 [Thelephora ganbajun]|uniref:Uncharacterized protein n=1 Tax=Thelephora ganbajun TaxID=370292 RepID=A0ACB6ZQ35_THEGA|nr:hypothetical protein BDM02DRAFT_455497 [Thelephora ganbajun]
MIRTTTTRVIRGPCFPFARWLSLFLLSFFSRLPRIPWRMLKESERSTFNSPSSSVPFSPFCTVRSLFLSLRVLDRSIRACRVRMARMQWVESIFAKQSARQGCSTCRACNLFRRPFRPSPLQPFVLYSGLGLVQHRYHQDGKSVLAIHCILYMRIRSIGVLHLEGGYIKGPGPGYMCWARNKRTTGSGRVRVTKDSRSEGWKAGHDGTEIGSPRFGRRD